MVSIIDLKNNKFKLKEYCFNHESHIKNFKYVVSLTLLILSQNKTREYYYFFNIFMYYIYIYILI